MTSLQTLSPALFRSLLFLLTLAGSLSAHAASTAIDWRNINDRRWPGSAFWANRLQDWSVRDGHLQCAYEHGGADWRTAHLLTHDLSSEGDRFDVELMFIAAVEGHAGILLGGGEGQLNFKQASMIQGIPGLGGGFLVDADFSANALCVRDFGTDAEVKIPSPIKKKQFRDKLQPGTPLTLKIVGQRKNKSTFTVDVTLNADGTAVATAQADVPADRLVGNVAIVSMGGTQQAPHGFAGLRLSGDRVAEHPHRAYGPIGGVLYSVAGGDLKVGVQCMSVGKTILIGDTFGKGNRIGVQLKNNNPMVPGNPSRDPWESANQTTTLCSG